MTRTTFYGAVAVGLLSASGPLASAQGPGGDPLLKPVSGVGARYGARDPYTAVSPKDPVKGAPTEAQARAYFISGKERETGLGTFGELNLVENVKLELGKGRSFERDVDPDDADRGELVYFVRGSFTSYLCYPISSAHLEGQSSKKTDYPNAEGYCYKTTFGDWRCLMTDIAGRKLHGGYFSAPKLAAGDAKAAPAPAAPAPAAPAPVPAAPAPVPAAPAPPALVAAAPAPPALVAAAPAPPALVAAVPAPPAEMPATPAPRASAWTKTVSKEFSISFESLGVRLGNLPTNIQYYEREKSLSFTVQPERKSGNVEPNARQWFDYLQGLIVKDFAEKHKGVVSGEKTFTASDGHLVREFTCTGPFWSDYRIVIDKDLVVTMIVSGLLGARPETETEPRFFNSLKVIDPNKPDKNTPATPAPIVLNPAPVAAAPAAPAAPAAMPAPAAVGASAPAAPGSPDWKTTVAKDYALSFEMPGAPETVTPAQFQLLTENNHTCFKVIMARGEGNVEAAAAQRFDAVRDIDSASMKGTVADEVSLTVGGHPARDFTVKGPAENPLELRFRLVASADLLVELIAIRSPESRTGPVAVKRFFNSLKFGVADTPAAADQPAPSLLWGVPITEAVRSDLFTFFKLDEISALNRATGESEIVYKPRGETFRALVTFKFVVDRDRRIQAAELSLARSFADHPEKGGFARDIAKSTLLALLPDADLAKVIDLVNEIIFGQPAGATPIVRVQPAPKLPDPPSEGYRTYLGDVEAFTQPLGQTVLSLSNARVDNEDRLIIAITPAPQKP